MAESRVDIVLKVAVVHVLPTKELSLISQLTGVYLGEGVKQLSEIPPADRGEVKWARRTLHE